MTARRFTIPAIVTAVAFFLGFLQKLPCHAAGWPYQRDLIFGQYCYSDVPVLFTSRGLIDGIFPYSPQTLEHPLEYPVITGLVMDWTARLTRFLDPNGDVGSLSQTYFVVNLVVLLGFALAVVWGTWALLRRTGRRPSDAILVAAAPTLALAGTINWDLVAVACAVLALLAWAHERPVLAGALIGLGTAAKLFPVFILGPLLILCLRERRLGFYAKAFAGAVGAWLVVNVPIMILYPDGWLEFWRSNASRPADFGSFWYALELQGHPVGDLNTVAVTTLVLLCAGIAAWAWFAPTAPTPAQLAFLVIAAFLVTNKVYSPQYVLWLLPFAVLAFGHVPLSRLVRDWLVWQAAEVFYWLMVWRYLAGTVDNDWLYPLATYLRIAATVYLCVSLLLSTTTAFSPSARPVEEASPAPS
jgi:uncharacterized membrane protein